MSATGTTTTDSLTLFDGGAHCPALAAKGLTLLRGRRAVLRDLNFTVAAGEIVAILGANGSGKTTLLQCLAGLLRPAAGECFWLGEAATRTSAARRRVGYLAHETGLYLELTARENLLFAARMQGLVDVSERVDESLARVRLESKASQPVHRLSQGMRKRLAIARAVIHRPLILLLDEPFANLDDNFRHWLFELLGELRQSGSAICFTSHEPDHCRRIIDRFVLLRGTGAQHVEYGSITTGLSIPFAARA
jgi:heme ABC exporter ATP-binding subunit CcmA